MHVDHRLALRKGELAGALERICQALELTDTQGKRAKGHYVAVGEWLAASDDAMLQEVAIYVQGSTVLGTTVKPLGRDEHDVDLAWIMHECSFSIARSANRSTHSCRGIVVGRLLLAARWVGSKGQVGAGG